MSTQTVFFNNPQSIVQLQTQVASLTGSVTSLNSQVVSLSGSVSSLQNQVDYPNFAATLVPPPYYDVYTQHFRQGRELTGAALNAAYFQLPEVSTIYNVPVNLSFVASGTLINPSQPIYGYDSPSGTTINMSGGQIWNNSFTGLNVAVHTADEQDYVLYTRQRMLNSIRNGVSYFQQRGMAVPYGWIPSGAQNVFANGSLGGTSYCASIEPIVVNNNITSVKVAALAATVTPDNSPITVNYRLNYNKTIGNYDPFKFSPMQLPVTTDYNVFKNLVGKTGTAFWDVGRRTISVDIPTGSYMLFDTSSLLSPNNTVATGSAQIFLNRFAGSFMMMARNPYTNSLDPTNFVPEMSCMVQVSPIFNFTTTRISVRNNVSSTLVSPIVWNREGPIYRKYDGYTLNRFNNGDARYKIYIIDPAVANATGQFEPDFYTDDTAGDNPNSFLRENAGSNSYQYLWDSAGLARVFVYADEAVFANPAPKPNQAWTILADPSKWSYTPNDDRYLNTVVVHEMMHNVHESYGNIRGVDTEGQGCTVETDNAVSRGVILTFRAHALVGYLYPLARGDFSLHQNNNTSTPDTTKKSNFYASYGAYAFYDYIRRRCDPNSQYFRRMNEIVALTSGEIVNYLDWEAGSATRRLNNNAGAMLASKQALQEVCNIDIHDLWKDYCVSIALLRNEEAIPQNYRTNYPFWLWSQNNPMNTGGYLNSRSSTTAVTNALGDGDAWWWDVYQNNQSIRGFSRVLAAERAAPASFSGALTNQSIIPTWPRLPTESTGAGRPVFFPWANAGTGVCFDYLGTGAYVSYMKHTIENMAMVMYDMPQTFNSVNIYATSGTIQATVVKFIPDGGNTGTFIQQPAVNTWLNIPVGTTGTINLIPFQGSGGITKLIVTNNQIINFGGIAGINNYFKSDFIYTGDFTITPA